MKKKLIKSVIVLISTMTLGMVFLPTTSVLADTVLSEETNNEQISNKNVLDTQNDLVIDNNLSVNNEISSENHLDFSIFDTYISVENNQYVLNLPVEHSFSEYEIAEAKKQLTFSNTLVFENNVKIDAYAEEAIITIPDGSKSRGIGNTYIYVYWNYLAIGIARHILRGGITATASAIAGSIAAYYTFGAASTFVARVVGGMVGAYAANKIHSGIWFHLNYVAGILRYGWQ